jgi:AhpC/TSA antioxidant enzyme
LQWSQRVPDLQQMASIVTRSSEEMDDDDDDDDDDTNVSSITAAPRLILVSVGTPENGRKLVDHLEFINGQDYLFVDPDNVLYDALDLNRGVDRTFFNINTPLRFLDRFTKQDGTKELGKVLSKWLSKNAFFIPPKPDQAFLQGGTFVFDGNETIFAHYDPSTGAHAPVEQVMEIMQRQVDKNKKNKMTSQA